MMMTSQSLWKLSQWCSTYPTCSEGYGTGSITSSYFCEASTETCTNPYLSRSMHYRE
ncbi:hypothetical protein NDU88_003251, partial [Pleurodeles waltl]